jgi:hypothetical protein
MMGHNRNRNHIPQRMLTIARDAGKGVSHLRVAVDTDVALDVAARLAVGQHIQQRRLQAAEGTTAQ